MPFEVKKDSRCCDYCYPQAAAGNWNSLLRCYVLICDAEDPEMRIKASDFLNENLLVDPNGFVELFRQILGVGNFVTALTNNLDVGHPVPLTLATCRLMKTLLDKLTLEPKTIHLPPIFFDRVLHFHMKQHSTRDAAILVICSLANRIQKPVSLRNIFVQDGWFIETFAAQDTSESSLRVILTHLPGVFEKAPDIVVPLVEKNIVNVLLSTFVRESLRSATILVLRSMLPILQTEGKAGPVIETLLMNGLLENCLALLEAGSPDAVILLELLQSVSLDKDVQQGLHGMKLFPRVTNILGSLTKFNLNSQGPVATPCLAILYSLLELHPRRTLLLEDSPLFLQHLILVCESSLEAMIKYKAICSLHIAAGLSIFREQVSEPSSLISIWTALKELMNLQLNQMVSCSESLLFNTFALLAFQAIMLYSAETLGNTADTEKDYSAFAVRALDCEPLWTLMFAGIKGNRKGATAQPFLFALHALASFPQKKVRDGLLSKLGSSSVVDDLLIISQESGDRGCVEMALLALGTLLGCTIYFPHVSTHFMIRVDKEKLGKPIEALSPEKKEKMFISERLADVAVSSLFRPILSNELILSIKVVAINEWLL